MNEIPEELLLYRTQLRDAIERNLHHRSPRLRVMRSRSFRLAIPTLAVLAAATAAVALGLTLSAASPENASAAAKKALAATAAAPSGTMTTIVLHGGVTHTLETTRWNGSDIAWSLGSGPIRLGPAGRPSHPVLQQLLLIGGGAYVQTSDGTWLHYANASDVGPKLVRAAQDNIAGATAQQILALATRVQKTTRSDGTRVYAGTIPNNAADAGIAPGDDPIMRMIFGSRKVTEGDAPGGHLTDSQLQMSVGGDGLVRQVSVTFQQEDTGSPAVNGTYTWSVTYSQLGSTPRITAPSSSTDVPPGTLPQNNGVPAPSLGQTFTPAEQANYLQAAACMRSHRIPNFPDPSFENNTVTFKSRTPIDTNSAQYKTALTICQKLIPAGLPYSSSDNAP